MGNSFAPSRGVDSLFLVHHRLGANEFPIDFRAGFPIDARPHQKSSRITCLSMSVARPCSLPPQPLKMQSPVAHSDRYTLSYNPPLPLVLFTLSLSLSLSLS